MIPLENALIWNDTKKNDYISTLQGVVEKPTITLSWGSRMISSPNYQGSISLEKLTLSFFEAASSIDDPNQITSLNEIAKKIRVLYVKSDRMIKKSAMCGLPITYFFYNAIECLCFDAIARNAIEDFGKEQV